MIRLFRLLLIVRQDLSLLWFALRHPSRPAWLLPAVGMLALYALEPLNLVLPPLGAIDDLILVPAVLHLLLTWLPVEIRAGFGGRSTLR